MSEWLEWILWKARLAYLWGFRRDEWAEEQAHRAHADWHYDLMEGRLHA